MTKTASFELATFTDAINKAQRVAPTKGAAVDKSAGIVIDIDPSRIGQQCLVMATDTEVTLRIVVAVLNTGDEAAVWRVPSNLLHGLTRSLPMTGGAEIELLDTGDGNVYIKSGKTKAKLRQIVGGYPIIEGFESDGMVSAPNLSARLAQVAWATDRGGTGVLSGVHIDGDFIFGCNRAELSMAPCKVPVEAPITAPLTDVSAIIKNTGEVDIRATSTRLQIMPDPYTQASCVLYAEPYPNVRVLIDKADPSSAIELNTDALLGMIDRTLVLVRDERLPATNIEIGNGVLKMMMSTDNGLIVDELDVSGTDGEALFKVSFSPTALRNAATASGRPTLTLRYGPSDRSPILLEDDNDFRALMMPRVVGS